MPTVPAGHVHLGHLDEAIKQSIGLLGPEVAHVAYRIRPDTTGEPSIYFRILLVDSAFREETIAALTRHIAEVMKEAVRPIEDWGLFPYFNYRSKSSQDQRPDPDWE
jgi:hypothetical protein